MDTGTFIIFSGKNQWFSNAGTNTPAVSIAPVGKGKGPKKIVVKNRATAKSEPRIVNKLFIEMAKLCEDPFWKTTLNDIAIGKYHRGFGFVSDSLTFKVRNKIHQCNLSDLTPEEALPKVLHFMRTVGSVMSRQDNDQQSECLKQMLIKSSMKESDSWGKVRSEQYRSILISKFIEYASSIYNLSEQEEDQLENIIRIGIIIKAFDSSTIEMNGGLITSIKGLLRDDNGKFYIDPSYIHQNKKTRNKEDSPVSESFVPEQVHPNKPNSINLEKKWRRFLDSLGKKTQTNETTSEKVSE